MTIPVEALRAARLQPGDQFEAEVESTGVVRLVRTRDPVSAFAGALTGAFDREAMDASRDEWD